MVDFLESLGDVDLPDLHQNTRDGLLTRTRSILLKQSDLPGAYLDMNVGKSLTLLTTEDVNSDDGQEYVGTDVLPIVNNAQVNRI